jgi:hypothetical protein
MSTQMWAQIIDLGGGWKLEYNGPKDWQIVNRDPNTGKRRWFRVAFFGQCPKIEEEPEEAFPVGINSYVNARGKPATPLMQVKGIVVKSCPRDVSEPIYRSNLTNYKNVDNGQIIDDGKFIELNGVRYQLYALENENAARMVGYTAFYCPIDVHGGRPVEILDAADLP